MAIIREVNCATGQVTDRVATPDELVVLVRPPSVADLANGKRAEIKAAAEVAVGTITHDYPAFERDTWPQQKREAMNYQADPTAPTPLLSAIAAEAGVTLADQVGRVLAKAGAYEIAGGAAIGKRRRLFAQVAAIEADAALTDDEKRAAINVVAW